MLLLKDWLRLVQEWVNHLIEVIVEVVLELLAFLEEILHFDLVFEVVEGDELFVLVEVVQGVLVDFVHVLLRVV